MNKKIIWEYKSFYKYNNDNGRVSEKLCEFLNENDIEDFKITQMRDSYIEIVYKKEKIADGANGASRPYCETY